MIATLKESVRVSRSHTVILRLIDRGLAGLLLLALTPALAVAAAAIWFLSGRRSPLVVHLRVGVLGRDFWMIKFRTMWPRSVPRRPEERGWIEHVVSKQLPDVKPRNDPRVTSSFAAAFRKYSLDELPQLWHVLLGEMSLVGPRPLVAAELDLHYGAQAAEVLEVLPGVTGLWQIMGRNDLSYWRRRRLDLFLVRHYSWRLYWKILLRTIPEVLKGSGAR